MKTLPINSCKIPKNIVYLIICGVLLLNIFGCARSPQHDEIEAYFRVLDKIKVTKKNQIVDYFRKIKQIVNEVNKDEKILHCFNVMRKYYNSNPTRTDAPSLYRLEYEMDVHYVKKYGDFYDILFVDDKGFVFHSIKHEADYHTNLFAGQFSGTQLAKHMKNNPDKEFVDYEFYSPSDEPAAFFLKPVQENNEMLGWLVLQFPINKINAILSDHKGLGRTGEVYLVNKNKLMLTDSRFIEDSTILKLKIDTDAVRLALAGESEKMIINDYRGVKVLSSFEQFDVFGHSWIIIVEIDEDEAVSNHYQKYKKFYLPRIIEYYSSIAPKIYTSGKEISKTLKRKRVDMNEFCMTRSGEVLETKGVGPCTTIIIYYPKRFGYLAHISPTDKIYQKSFLLKYLPWVRKTGFLEELIKRIQYYDIYPYQLKDLQFVIIATHDKSLQTIIDSLYDMGVNLAQIKFLFNPLANYANIAFNQSDDSVSVEWLAENRKNASFFEHASNIDSIGTTVKRITAK
ncbi:MAG: cache domain-containing protein [Candidatus Brocadia sp.]